MPRRVLVYRVAFSTPWFEIEESIAENPGELPYYRMTGPNGAICMPFTPDGDIVMVRQFRPNLGRMTLELPAGAIDPGETAEQAAAREIVEETGREVADLSVLGTGRLHLNRTTHQEFFLLAFDAKPIAGAVVEAGIEAVVVPRSDFCEAVHADKIEQIAAVTFHGMAFAKLGINLMTAPIQLVRQKTKQYTGRRCADGN